MFELSGCFHGAEGWDAALLWVRAGYWYDCLWISSQRSWKKILCQQLLLYLDGHPAGVFLGLGSMLEDLAWLTFLGLLVGDKVDAPVGIRFFLCRSLSHSFYLFRFIILFFSG